MRPSARRLGQTRRRRRRSCNRPESGKTFRPNLDPAGAIDGGGAYLRPDGRRGRLMEDGPISDRRAGAALVSRSNLVSASMSRLLDALTPPLCPITNERVSAPGIIAARAWAKLRFIDDPVCARCGAPFSHEVGKGVECAGCIADPPEDRKS